MSDEHPHNKQYWNRSNLHCKFSILTKEEELWFMDMKNRNKKSVQKTEWVTILYWVTAPPPPSRPPIYQLLSLLLETFWKKSAFSKKIMFGLWDCWYYRSQKRLCHKVLVCLKSYHILFFIGRTVLKPKIIWKRGEK